MVVTTTVEYCDRCKQEIPRTRSFPYVFDKKLLHIKFHRIKFSIFPYKRYDGEIDTKYNIEKNLSLCPDCAKEIVDWWEEKGEKK